jgi:hypothetical protein
MGTVSYKYGPPDWGTPMETMMERLARKKAAPQPAEITVLPLLKKEHEHEGACGDGCGCGQEEGGCCGG